MPPIVHNLSLSGVFLDISINDRFVFFGIAVALIIPWLWAFINRPQLRKKMIRAGLFGGLMAPPAEYWYFSDYWRPPGLFGYKIVFIEDFLFGFAVTGLSAIVYEVLFNAQYEKTARNYKKLFLGMFAFGIGLMMLFNTVLGFNSMITSCICFVFFTVFVLVLRPDLLMQSVLSAFLMLIVILIVYVPLFDIFNTTYWQKYWLLYGTNPWGIILFGNIPLTELMWYFFWGGFAGIAHPFASGRVRVKNADANTTIPLPTEAL